MKKIFMLLSISLIFAMTETRAACTNQLKIDITTLQPIVNVSGSGSASITYFVLPQGDPAGYFGNGYPDCSFDLIMKLKTVASGTVVYSDSFHVICGSFYSPCYPASDYRWDDIYPNVLSFTIPNQSCGDYYVEPELKNMAIHNSLITTNTVYTHDVGGVIAVNYFNSSGNPPQTLGTLNLVNFSSGLTASTSSVQATCGASDGSATVAPSGGTSPYSYSWYGTSATGATISSVPAGTYTCTIVDAGGCAVTKTVTITNAPLSVSISPGSQTVCKDKCLTLTATVTPSGSYTYTWLESVGGGGWTTIGSGSSICVRPVSLSRTSMTSTVYRVDVTNGAGCTGTASVTITVDPSCTISFYNGCCDGGDERSIAPGNTNDETASLTITPNPVSEQAHILFNLPSGEGHIRIYSSSGQLVKQIDGLRSGGEVLLDAYSLAPGIYEVILYGADQQLSKEKMIITN